MKLIIKGLELELTPNQNISRTLQVNDILTLSNRQSNYSNTFSVKRTDKNKQVFELLGVPSITNFIPYELNECYLYTHDGECMVYKGRAVIQSTDKDYKINIYDGNIDLYKAIENKSLGDLDLSEINHSKLLSTVVNSFTANLNYKYIVADYNGEMVYNSTFPVLPTINIDYLIPSAKVSYLWNKIFTTYGFTFSGSVFNTVDFTNLWLSYPKTAVPNTPPVELFNGKTLLVANADIVEPLEFTQSIITDVIVDINKQEFIIPRTGTYQLEVNKLGNGVVTYAEENSAGSVILYTSKTPYIYVNSLPVASSDDNAIELNLVQNDVITVKYFAPVLIGAELFYGGTFEDQLIIKEYQGEIVSFSNELKDFNIKDFITEILNRFGLTPFKDRYSNHYTFKTLQELLQNNDVVDWSRNKNKFTEFVSESYIFGSYAQENNFTYKYNDSESDYYDSEITINNVNLADAKTVVNSKVYAPEKDRTTLIHDLQTNVYKMWDKEVKDNGSVGYKGLQKRYYLMREDSHTFTTTTQIGSKTLSTQEYIQTIPVESFYNLRMNDIVRIYYDTIGAILNYSKLVKAKVYLTETDIANIDFSKLYWIKELGNYFLLNKVNNFTEKGTTNVELIKVDYSPAVLGVPAFLINDVKNKVPRLHFGLGQREISVVKDTPIKIYQDTIYNPDMYEIPNPPIGSTLVYNNLNEMVVSYPTSGTYSISIVQTTKDKSISITSNEITVTVTDK